MKYNKSWLKNRTRTLLKDFFTRSTGYYLYPKFRVARDFNFSRAYEAYDSSASFVNLGAGEYFYHPRWKNYDLYEDSLVRRVPHFFNYDLRFVDSTPFPESNVELFYCAHTLEHIPRHLTLDVLHRIYEALKPGGLVRIVVPDAEAILGAYDSNDSDFFKPYTSWFLKRGADTIEMEDYLVQLIATPKCRIYNESIRHHDPLLPEQVQSLRAHLSSSEFLDALIQDLPDNNSSGTDHLNWFTAQKLISLLSQVGFTDVYRSSFGQSKELVLRQIPLFDETLPYLSLYVEARK